MKRITDKMDRALSFFIPARFEKYHKVIRYLFSGGTAAFVDLALLYVFTSVLYFWYLVSAILAFIVAFVVSFILQKFWTFTDHSTDAWKSQAVIYLIITSTNLGLNTLLMYLFVDYFHIHYMISQFIISGILAVESYFIYQIFVFKERQPQILSELPHNHDHS